MMSFTGGLKQGGPVVREIVIKLLRASDTKRSERPIEYLSLPARDIPGSHETEKRKAPTLPVLSPKSHNRRCALLPSARLSVLS